MSQIQALTMFCAAIPWKRNQHHLQLAWRPFAAF